jgi:hypothetical protein
MGYKLIGDIEDGVIHAGYSANGAVFKSEEAYLHYPDEICYVPEYGFPENTGPYKGAVEDVEGYTHHDLLKLCDGDEKLCDAMFSLLDWQFPETWLNEIEDDEY